MLSIVCATSRLAEEQSQVVDHDGISSRNLFADRVGLGEYSESRIGGYAETRTRRCKWIESATKVAGLCSPRTATWCAGDGTP